jgi:hypothetical protein
MDFNVHRLSALILRPLAMPAFSSEDGKGVRALPANPSKTTDALALSGSEANVSFVTAGTSRRDQWFDLPALVDLDEPKLP